MALFDRIRLSESVRDWFGRMIRQWSQHQQQESRVEADAVQRQLSLLRGQEDQLLNLRLAGEIGPETFATKKTEVRDRIASYMVQLDSTQQVRDDHADLAAKVFELSQSLKGRWLSADYAAKRRILEILCLNLRMEGATLVPEWRKPFDVLVEGLSVQLSRGDKI